MPSKSEFARPALLFGLKVCYVISKLSLIGHGLSEV